MSEIVRDFRFKVDGVLTDASSVVLRDPGNTFGLRRDDTGEVLLAAGTALSHVGVGIYRLAFDPPSPALPYSYYVEVIYLGSTYRFERKIDDLGSLPDGDGRYATVEGVKRVLGIQVTKDASNLENDTADAYDFTTIYADITYADAWVDEWVGSNDTANYETPIDSTKVKASTFTMIRLAANLYASYLLLSHKEHFIEEAQTPNAKRMTDLKSRAEEIMRARFGNPVAGIDAPTTGPEIIEPGTFENYPLERTGLAQWHVCDEY